MDEVRRLRLEKGWSQNELAYHAKLAPSVISLIETGKREPNATTLRKLAGAFEVRIPDLFEDSGSGKAQRRSSPEPKPFNGLEGKRRPSVFAEVLINAAVQLEDREPPASLGDIDRTFGMLDVIYSIAEPLIELTDDSSTWEDRFSADERKEILAAGTRLHQAGKRLLEPTNEYLDRRHENIENREASRKAEAAREKIREWNRRLSA